jgi:hypothetical protein
MRCWELFEDRQHLPFAKGRLDVMRGSYAAFVCVMSPMDFIRLTTTNQYEIDQIFSQDSPSVEDYKNGNHEYMRMDNHYMPFLRIVYPDGNVTGHEGRHRAAMIYKAGGKTFPCVLLPKPRVSYELSYRLSDTNRAGEEEYFDNEQQAEIRQSMLRAETDEEGYRKYQDISLRTMYPDFLKGHPERSDGWDKAAWKNEDAPKQLIGQFNPNVVVTNFKCGIVKGYRHFKR